jgi:hypothetical protein
VNDYEAVVAELGDENLRHDSTWQISGRLLPHYHRPGPLFQEVSAVTK